VRIATDGIEPAVVFDGVGGAVGHAAFQITAPGGRLSDTGPAGRCRRSPGADESDPYPDLDEYATVRP
jgi:NADPH:quinone reductase-like Zn-dependent oxidoreductase